jgi:hypothetical protein
MSNIFSLSFSNSNFQIAHHIQNDDQEELQSLNSYDYPFDFSFDCLFENEQIDAMSNIIKQQKGIAKIDNLSLMVSLPLNYSLQKKIALPIEVEQNIINEQVEWELSHYLPGQLSQYKVIMTNSSFDFSGYREVLFICIKKDIIKNISALAQLCDGVLTKLLVENLTMENYINKKNIFDPNKNQILFNVDTLQFVSHFYFSGKYYNSYSENINPLKSNTYNEKALKRSKEQYLNIKNLNEQLPFGKSKELEIFVYGQAFTDELFGIMKENFSCTVRKFDSSGYLNLDNIEIEKYVEALGICC